MSTENFMLNVQVRGEPKPIVIEDKTKNSKNKDSNYSHGNKT